MSFAVPSLPSLSPSLSATTRLAFPLFAPAQCSSCCCCCCCECRARARGEWGSLMRALYDDGFGGASVKDYFDAARAIMKDDGGPPRWFCPVECKPSVEDPPLLLFLPGSDGVGMGLISASQIVGK
uniref:Uncharacterized protein n=1 Tax=Ananas comosus var. bracteatus TaxID=296719 RepID=A0A6V7PH54_ANACO|nr:unnamed protein product [Ananas comosus var. bracteatus]